MIYKHALSNPERRQRQRTASFGGSAPSKSPVSSVGAGKEEDGPKQQSLRCKGKVIPC